MAAQYAEIVEGGDGTYTSPLTLRGRINAMVSASEPPWNGVVHVQRRYKMPDATWSDWMTVEVLAAPGLVTLVEHEADVQFRMGNPEALGGGGHPLMRISL